MLAHGYMMLEEMPETMTLSMFSEEGMEGLNKNLKGWEKTRAGQFSRETRLLDVMNRANDRSDPIILTNILRWRKQVNSRKEHSPEVLALAKDNVEMDTS